MNMSRLSWLPLIVTAVASCATATPAQIAAARTIFANRDDSVMVIIGDAAKIGDAIGKYGPVTKVALSAPGFGPK